MFHNIELKEGAFLLGDAHYSHKRLELLDFLEAIYSKKLLPTQLIFMGDIFDTLFGKVAVTIEDNKEAIKLINKIAQDIEVVYLEGNHDFNLKDIFTNAKVVGLLEQPFKCTYNDKTIYLAHGDFNIGFWYKLYSLFIRNSFIVYMLNMINNLFSNIIINKLDNYLAKKDDCNDFKEFEQYIGKRLDGRYRCDYFVEGHYHQNKIIEFKNFKYINLAAFACNQRYFIVNSCKDIKLLEEKSF